MADVSPQGTSRRRHAVSLLALGRRVAEHGELGEELRQETARLLQRTVARARQDGAQRLGLVGTEALRRAQDCPLLVDQVQQMAHLRLRVLTGELEARLSYLGGTAFRVATGQGATLADIGGGSTEVVQGTGTRPAGGVSLRLGSDRILQATGADDPPSPRQRADAALRISMTLEAAPEPRRGDLLIATGGTAANLPVLLDRWDALPDSSEALFEEGEREPWLSLSRDGVKRALGFTARHPAAEVARRTGLSPERARLMAGGTMVLWGLMEHYRAESLLVTEHGLRDGVLLRLAAAPARSPA
ncbi:MAG: hypothetical protein ACREN7_05365 [Candidatus Dormibacteria bacterium]